MTEDLPTADEFETCLNRWVGEPVKTVIIPTRLFLSNRSGYPVLCKEHQDIVKAFFRFKIHIVVKGGPLHNPSDGEENESHRGLALYMMYIRHLFAQVKAESPAAEQWHMAYNDYLQAPLQPLMDNLESQVGIRFKISYIFVLKSLIMMQIYETFEKDPVKYERYEAAIVKALRAVVATRTQGPAPNMTLCDPADLVQPVVVTVVGAGRGPLVAAALGASSTTGSSFAH